MGGNISKENEAPAVQARSLSNNDDPHDASIKVKQPSAETQAYLLHLLNRPKPAQSETHSPLDKSADLAPQTPSASARGSTSANAGDVAQVLHDREEMVEPPAAQPSQGLFTYTNPFEELAASSPRNRTPKPSSSGQQEHTPPVMQILKAQRNITDGSDLKRKADTRSPIINSLHSKQKLSATASPTALENPKRSDTDTDVTHIIAKSLEELDIHVQEEIAEPIFDAQEDQAQAKIEQDLRHVLDAKSKSEFEAEAQIAAIAIKKELEKPGNKDILKESLPPAVAEQVKEIIDEAAEGHMPDSWESEEIPSKDDENAVKVYNFPMKPWISITVHPDAAKHQLSLFKDDEIFDVARLKKEFDQVDRTLVTASTGFVVYGMSKNGGLRVIRQLDGKDIKLFEETRDRVFSVSISTANDSPAECAIGTGVSGTVYWADLRAAEGEYLQDASANPNNHGFALPPIHSPGEETSGGMLKTRARKSSCHPEFFAVGRGKSIHIIWPAVITKQSYLKHGKDRVVDLEKYLKYQSLKINTGKAGKDFIFSQDDTTIVSLDKAGKVKFWDVQTLTNTARGDDPRIPTPEQIQPVEINDPIMSFNTTRENTKAWPTSVQFIDKLRPYQKGGPLRYLLVGMKQNHTLQLWDLVLRRAVQEIKLPHEKESDAVCSIAYHPNTGILAVGHPTRNSIFFIHVSAPKYDAPKTCSQAEFMQRLANKDPSIASPKSTAVMSGIREYSFAPKGELRSLDMLQNPTTASEDPENPVLFELYTMHSKGITYLAIRQDDMGWNKDSRVIVPVDAAADGIITVESLKEVANQETSIESPSPKPISTPKAFVSDFEPRRSKDVTPKDTKDVARNVPKTPQHPQADSIPSAPRSVSPVKATGKTETSQPVAASSSHEPVASSEKADKSEKPKKKKDKKASAANASSAKDVSDSPTPSNGISETPAAQVEPLAATSPALSEGTIEGIIKRVESSVSAEVSKLLGTSIEGLHKRIESDRRAQAAQGAANQEAIIRLVASTLDDNIGKKMEHLVGHSIKETVLPSIAQVASKAVAEQLSAQLGVHFKQNLGKEMRATLPDAITKSLHNADVLRLMSESLASGVQLKVEEQFASIMQTRIVPTFTQMAVQAAQQATAEMQQATTTQIEINAREANAKIDKLTEAIGGLGQMISDMAAIQTDLQARFLKLQKESLEAARGSQAPTSASASASRQPSRALAPQKTPDDIAVDRVLPAIAQLMAEGNCEQACMEWLQVPQSAQGIVFDKYFSTVNPLFVRGLSPLMQLSLVSVCSKDIEGPLLLDRLAFIEVVLRELASATNEMVSSPAVKI